MSIKIFGYTVPPIAIVIIVLLLFTTPAQKESLWDAAKQICNLQDTVTVTITDSFIATGDDEYTKEQLLKLKSIGKVSLNVAEHTKLIEDLYEKKKIKLNPGCIIVGVI